MEGFVGRRDLLSREELQVLSAKSDLAGAVQLGSHVAALAVMSALIAATWGSWWVVLPFLAQGILINWLYCAQHELSHGTVFRTRWLNEAMGRVTGDWEKDPELQRDPYELQGYLLWFTGVSYWWTRISRLGRLTFGKVSEPYIRESEKALVIREARWHVFLYALIAVLSVALQTWVAVVYWLAPMLLTKWAYMLQGTIKHLGRPHGDNLFENTRTARAGWLFHWLGWNMQYHTAHHLFPSVPFHRLPRLHRAIVSKAGQVPPTMGYFEFQREAVAKLATGRERIDYPDDAPWIEPSRPQPS